MAACHVLFFMMANHILIYDAAGRRWLQFRKPRRLVTAYRPEEVVACLQQVDDLVERDGLHAAGFVGYEAAPGFDSALVVREDSGEFPLVWFGLYDEPEVVGEPQSDGCHGPPLPWTPSISRDEYGAAFAAVKQCIADGETYQVNYTMRLRSDFAGEPLALFASLVRQQRAGYGAYLDIGRFAICSASPELFFRLEGNRLTGKPMKGTARRGLTLEQDRNQERWLRLSEKNRAENLMIVDMMRNDMGRLAECGTVRVPTLFDTECYPTVWQMTSGVTARTNAAFPEIMAALFPCASITGAPKAHTMQIIAGLETTPRRIYTGCIGFLAPGRVAQFNVAIRTILVDRQTGQAEYGVGGGVVWDSDCSGEYEECRLKASVLSQDRPEFDLLESLLWTPVDGYFLLDRHLSRLADSAEYFGFPVDLDLARQKLEALAETLPGSPHKVRLLARRDGHVDCKGAVIGTVGPDPVRLRLARRPVDSSDPFLYHKTTHRRVYEAAKTDFPDCDDVALWNERGEVTETCIANLVVEVDGALLTPPVASGLLGGTMRARLLEEGRVREGVVTVHMLRKSPRICVVNSVRKWREAVLEG